MGTLGAASVARGMCADHGRAGRLPLVPVPGADRGLFASGGGDAVHLLCPIY